MLARSEARRADSFVSSPASDADSIDFFRRLLAGYARPVVFLAHAPVSDAGSERSTPSGQLRQLARERRGLDRFLPSLARGLRAPGRFLGSRPGERCSLGAKHAERTASSARPRATRTRSISSVACSRATRARSFSWLTPR